MKMGKYVRNGEKYIAIQVDMAFKYKKGKDNVISVDPDDWLLLDKDGKWGVYTDDYFTENFTEYVEEKKELKKAIFWVEGTILKSDLPKITSDIQALELSIKKWEVIRDWIKENNQVIDNGYSGYSCALCEYTDGYLCTGCPVFKKTGKPYCGDTPYHKYRIAEGDDNVIDAYFAADEEVKFLQSILDEYKNIKRTTKDIEFKIMGD